MNESQASQSIEPIGAAAFSLIYGDEGGYNELAVDWCWQYPGWARSQMIGPGRRWEAREGLDKEAYEGLLKCFSLQDRAPEFPLEKIINMSPAELAKISGVDPYSDTIDSGGSRKASEVNDT